MEDFLHFLDECPTPYHFIAYARRELLQNGFVELNEKTHFNFDQLPNQKAFVVRDERSIIAFKLNNNSKPNSGESVVGICTNCDSPCFKLKYHYQQNPYYGEVTEQNDSEEYKNAFFNNSSNNEFHDVYQGSNKSGYQLIRLSLYGAALWQTFFDRDLRLAGLVYVRDPKTNQITQKLVDSKRGVAVLPNSPMHTNHTLSLSPSYDPEKHFSALFNIMPEKDTKSGLHSYVASLLDDPSITGDQIVDWDLRFIDANNSCNFDNLVFSSRLSNLSSCYAGLKAIISDKPLKLQKTEDTSISENSETQENQENVENLEGQENQKNAEGTESTENAEAPENSETTERAKKSKKFPPKEKPVELEIDENPADDSCGIPIQVFAVFDNESAESNCRSGAKSDFLQSILTEIYHYYSSQEPNANDGSEVAHSLKIKNSSVLISCGSTHCTHPNNDSPSDSRHPSVLGKGPVLRSTTRSSLSSELIGIAVVNEASKQGGIPLQHQYLQNTQSFMPSIGPSIAFKTGIRTVDLACPILSMNSVRETMNYRDIVMLTALISELLNHYNKYRMDGDAIEDVKQ